MSEELRHLKDRASRAHAEGRLRDALQALELVLEHQPHDLAVQLKVGDVLRRLGRKDAAVAAYEPVASAYAEQGHLLKAIAVCKVILTVDPGHTATQGRLADLYAKRQQPGEPPVAPRSFGRGIPESSTSFVRRSDIEAARAGAGHSIPSAPRTSAEPLPKRRVPPPVAQTWVGQARVEDLGAPSAGDGAAVRDRTPGTPSSSGGASGGLPQIPLFSELPRAAFIQLLVRMKMRELSPGETVIREGQPGESFFVVAYGQVRITRRNDRGQAVLLARLRDGAFFGEMALLQPGPRTATVTAEAETQVLEISKQVLDEVIAEYPSVATALSDFHRQRLLATCMATHELFQPFDVDERRALMAKFKSRTFERGSVLLHEGQPPSGLYIVLHGRLVVTRQVDGQEATLAELQPGSMFGEMSLLANEPTNATVVATTDCFVLRLSRQNFNEVMMTHPQTLELVAQVSDQRREANQVLLDMHLTPHAAMLV